MIHELQILLGLNCNFRCENCLNSSYPGNVDYDLSDDEITIITSEAEGNQNIKVVSFSGGEPLLYLSKIKILLSRLREKRKDLIFSITTNGSLLKKYFDEMKSFNIDYAIISYDIDHSEFLDLEKLKESLNIAKILFKSYEINFVYQVSPSQELIRQLTTISDIKVTFNHQINSGRGNLKDSANENHKLFSPIICPNMHDKLKITFVPQRGFTICCGPLIFNNFAENTPRFHPTLLEVKEGILFKVLTKAKSVQLPNIDKIPCHNCYYNFSKFDNNVLEMFLSSSVWKNVITGASKENLDTLNLLFNPKYIKCADIKTITNPFQDTLPDKAFDIKSGDHLEEADIQDFSDFTFLSFYQKHQRYYSLSDFERFKKEQKFFFNLPNKFIFHYSNKKLVAALVLCFIKEHPHFKQDSWHIGYWGISDSITTPSYRESIKSCWGNLLHDLNQNNIIASNIDYFNESAIIMTRSFNFIGEKIRLDPRL